MTDTEIREQFAIALNRMATRVRAGETLSLILYAFDDGHYHVNERLGKTPLVRWALRQLVWAQRRLAPYTVHANVPGPIVGSGTTEVLNVQVPDNGTTSPNV